MDTTAPTLITIELQPADERRGGWRARTRVDGRRARTTIVRETSGREPSIATIVAGEAPNVAWTPQPYEPGPCACVTGICDRDHENE